MSRFTDPEPVARRFDRRRDWDAAREAAFDRAVLNQTLLACALRNYITAVQVGDTTMIRSAEEDAFRALTAVGGPHGQEAPIRAVTNDNGQLQSS